jgi:hypothetical protein
MDNRQSADSITAGERLISLEDYDRILRRAHAARAEFLRNVLYNCAHKLRERICAGAERLRINFWPMCCQ